MIVIAPAVDMLLVSKNSRNRRKSLMNFAPRIGLSTVDYGRLHEIDNFYLDCQKFRDYYRDPYNKLPRPFIFNQHAKFGNRCHDKSNERLMQPSTWVQEKHPIIYPINYSKNLVYEGIRLGGLHYYSPCIKYKQ